MKRLFLVCVCFSALFAVGCSEDPVIPGGEDGIAAAADSEQQAADNDNSDAKTGDAVTQSEGSAVSDYDQQNSADHNQNTSDNATQPDNDQSSGGSGNATCTEVWDCISACGQDTSCGQNCFNTGSTTAKQAYNALAKCGNENCAEATSDQEYMQCLMSACSAEYDACEQNTTGGGGGTGSATTCVGIDNCNDSCAASTSQSAYEACMNSCVSPNVPAAELDKFSTLIDCLTSSGCDDAASCEKACCTQIVACGYTQSKADGSALSCGGGTGNTNYPNGIKITGDITLYHPTAIADGKGGFTDASQNLKPCTLDGTLPADKVYGTLSVSVNSPSVNPGAPAQQPSGNEKWLQKQHAFSGKLGTKTIPTAAEGVTINYTGKDTSNNTYLMVEDYNGTAAAFSNDYVLRLYCKEPVSAGVNDIDAANCWFFVEKFTSDWKSDCIHAVGISSKSRGIGNGLTIVK